MKNIHIFIGIVTIALCSTLTTLAYAQHPIEVEREEAQQQYLRAMVSFDQIPDRRKTTASIIAAARSAWALGLTDRARKEFDRALRDASLPTLEKASLLISRGIIEFQDGHQQVASLFGERAVSVLDTPSPLRAHGLLLWGQSLERQDQLGLAQAKLVQALSEANVDQQAEIRITLGRVCVKLGSYEQAREMLEGVPSDDERAADAIRLLAEVALATHDGASVDYWLSLGREKFPQQFLDSWVDYAKARTAIEREDTEAVRRIMTETATRFAPSDPWILLLNAAAEMYLWQETRSKPRAIHGGSPS